MEDGRTWCVRPDSPSPELISQGLLPHLFGSLGEGVLPQGITLSSTRELLEAACREERAFQLALITLDSASSRETRNLAEEALDEFLEYAHVVEFIENNLFSRPLPEHNP